MENSCNTSVEHVWEGEVLGESKPDKKLISTTVKHVLITWAEVIIIRRVLRVFFIAAKQKLCKSTCVAPSFYIVTFILWIMLETLFPVVFQVGGLDFPNRRFFGNRAEEFVRARRAQLEVW